MRFTRKRKRKLIDLRMFDQPEELRSYSAEELVEWSEEEERPLLWLAAAGVQALFCIANELDGIRRNM